MGGGIDARAVSQFTISAHIRNVAGCKGDTVVFSPPMGPSAHITDELRQTRRRPGVVLVYGALFAAWLLLLVHDLAFARWRFVAGDWTPLRLALPLIPLLLMALRIGRREPVDDGQTAFGVVLRMTVIFIVTVAVTGVLALLYGYGDTPPALDVLGLITGRLIGLVVLVGVSAALDNLLTILRFRERGRISVLARIYGWTMASLLAVAQLLPTEMEAGGSITIPEAPLVISILCAVLAFILGIRIGWIINLRKKQKWGLLGVAAVGFIAAAALLIMIEQAALIPPLYSHGGGYALLAFAGAMTFLFWFMVIFVTALFALPTAEAIDRRNAEVSRMATLARLLTQSLDPAELVDSAVALAREATSAHGAWIEIGDDRGIGGIEFQYGTEQQIPPATARRVMDAPVPGGGTLREAVVAKQRLQVVDRINGVFWNGSSGPPLRSAAGAPLLLGERLLGALYLAKDRVHGFDREDMTVLTALADQVSLALEHSDLIRRSMEQERLQQEMLIAQDLQQRLLPRVMPQSPFYELYAESLPASIVGGDYFDVVAFDDQTIGLVVADVSGKGASAALYMGVIKGIVQALSGTCHTPGELLARANVALHGSIDQRWFVTMTCAQIIEEGRRLRIARAGHCPALLIQSGTGCYSRPKGIGLAIARPRLFEANLEVEDREFLSGEYVIFMSDGIPEARSPDGDEFGYERILETVERGAAENLDPRAIRDHLFGEIETFRRGEPPHDDSTIVVLQWK